MHRRSLVERGIPLLRILNEPNGAAKIILQVLSLEDQLEELHQHLAEDPTPEHVITVEEFATEDGHLQYPNISEESWITTFKMKTGLDIRAVLSDLPKEIGLFNLKVACKDGNNIKYAIIRCWVVPAGQGEEGYYRRP